MRKQAPTKHTGQHDHTERPFYTEAEQNRLLQHLLQLENNFNNRLNTFLVMQTILFSAVTLLYSKQDTDYFILIGIISLGLGLTLIWAYAQARQRYIYLSLKKRCMKELKEFRDTQEERAKQRWPISTTVILTFITPALMALLWVAFLVYLLGR